MISDLESWLRGWCLLIVDALARPSQQVTPTTRRALVVSVLAPWVRKKEQVTFDEACLSKSYFSAPQLIACCRIPPLPKAQRRELGFVFQAWIRFCCSLATAPFFKTTGRKHEVRSNLELYKLYPVAVLLQVGSSNFHSAKVWKLTRLQSHVWHNHPGFKCLPK